MTLYTIWGAGVPTFLAPPYDPPDTDAVNLGTYFTPSINGTIKSARFYKGHPSITGTRKAALYSYPANILLASKDFTSETSSGWQQVDFDTPVPVTAGNYYVVVIWYSNGNYIKQPNFLATGFTNSPLSVPVDGGRYTYAVGIAQPLDTFNHSCYYSDVVLDDGLSVPVAHDLVGSAPITITASGVLSRTVHLVGSGLLNLATNAVLSVKRNLAATGRLNMTMRGTLTVRTPSTDDEAVGEGITLTSRIDGIVLGNEMDRGIYL